MKHGTPDDLDWFFERDYLDPSDYADFWQTYWYDPEFTLSEIDDFLYTEFVESEELTEEESDL